MEIRWLRCKTYEDAKDFSGVVYLHEWNKKPFYWGICDKSVFGGNRRKLRNGKQRSPRYGSSYKHWIEGCLKHGGYLYIGTPNSLRDYGLKDIEFTLIEKYEPVMKNKHQAGHTVPNIDHQGCNEERENIPTCLRN